MNKQSTVVQVTSYGMGNADEALRITLVKNYFTLLDKENYLPDAILFYAEGVKLLCKGSPVIESLQALSKKNVKILACKTCLNHYQLLDTIEVGIIATMVDIIDIQFTAEKIINI